MIGPVGVPAVYRWPLRAIPLAEANPPPPPHSPVIEFAVIAAQVTIVIHSVATYPWDKRYQWAGDLFCYCFVSMAMMPSLSRTLTDRGYSSTWALLAPLGPAGLAVVYLLPDRHARPALGFQVESSTLPAD